MATLAHTPPAVVVKGVTPPTLWSRIWRYRFAYLLILPTLIMMTFVHILPIMQGAYMSLLDLNGPAKMRLYLGAEFIWFDNYNEFLTTLLSQESNATISTVLNAAKNT